jgi:hypothetical protein
MAAKRKRTRGLGAPQGRPRVANPKRSPEPSPKDRNELDARPVHLAVDLRRNHVADLLERGVISQKRILEALALRGIVVVQSVLSKDITAIREEWKESRVSDFESARDYARNAALATLRESWAGWEKSKEDQVTTRRVITSKPKQGDTAGALEHAPVMIERKSSAGNPEFLTRAQAAIDELCKIDGLYAKIKLEHDPDGGLAEIAAMLGLDRSLLPSTRAS